MTDAAARLRALLSAVQAGRRSVDDALRELQHAGAAAASDAAASPFDFATVDHDRHRRCGFPEVVFCERKTPADAAAIAAEILHRSDRLLMTRASAEHAAAVAAVAPRATFHERARCIAVAPEHPVETGLVAVVSAGTADLPVAEEAIVTARLTGSRVAAFADVGVAGVHRLLARIDAIRRARVVVVVAGMEGALPSVVGGLVDRPVIAVPTSVGYGASFGGLAALLTMLNSCAAGVGVVNIDNGFGAGYLASQINRLPAVGDPAPTAPDEPIP